MPIGGCCFSSTSVASFISLALPAVWFFHQKRFAYAIVLLLIAVQFHFTALIMAGCLLTVRFFPGVRSLVLFIFLVAMLIAVLGFKPASLLPFAGFSALLQAKVNGYGNRISLYQTGFRLDFSLFNLVFLWVGIRCRKQFSPDSLYGLIVTLYGLLSSVFVLAFQLPYSDRVGLWSWILIPLIVALPILQREPKRTGWLVMGAVLAGGISLYMTRIHYQSNL